MKRHYLLTIIIVMTLLIAPIVNAFSLGSMPVQGGCGMDMSFSEHQSMMLPGASEHESSQTMADMPCCDHDSSSACCGAQCHCVAFSGSVIWQDTTNFLPIHRMSTSVLSVSQIRIDMPFIIKPKRPPISLVS